MPKIPVRKPAAKIWKRSRDRLLEQQRTLAALTRSHIFTGDSPVQTIQLLTRTSAQQMGVERASLWRITEDRTAIRCEDLYESSRNFHAGGGILRIEDYPHYFRGLAAEEAIVANDAHNHPFTREFSADYLPQFGISSMLDVPIHLYGQLEGVFCHEHVGPAIEWTPDQRLFAIAIANLAALAIEQTERKRAEALIRGQRDVLEMIANGASLPHTLKALIDSIEQQDSQILCAICLLDTDGVHLRSAAASRLPESYCKAIDGMAIGPVAGSCGTAAYTKQTVIVGDIQSDPLWADFRGIAKEYGLGACWSTPIFDSQQRVVGTFAVYYREPRSPSADHRRLVEMATHTAAIAIERALAGQRIEHLAYYDALTELPNRSLFHDRVSQVLTRAERDGKEMAILFIDLDRFKTINDSLGHDIGDRLLQAVARRMNDCLREADTISRLGGDEFVVLLPETGAQGAAHVAQNILERAVGPYDIDGHHLSISSSIGISLYPHDGTDVETLIKSADTAMYHAKENGAATYQFFTREMNVAVFERLTVENGLRHALDTRPVRALLPAPDRHQDRAHDRRRGPDPLAASADGDPPGGQVHPGCRGDRADRGDRRVGSARGLPAEPRVAARRPARDPGGGQPVRPAVAQAYRADRGARSGRHRAGGELPGPGVDRARDDAGRRGHAHDAGQPQEHGRQALGRRLRNRLLQPRLSEASAHRQGQDRPVLHSRYHRATRTTARSQAPSSAWATPCA